jgi:hypothetical protein
MPSYDEIRDFIKDSSLEEKISIFRQEVRPIVSSVRGYSNLITMMVKERGAPNMPDDFLAWCETLVENSGLLQDWIEATCYPDHRSIYQEKDATRDREFGESLWKHQQAGLPELEPYQSLRDAIIATAQNMELPLVDPSLTLDDHFWYPGGGITLMIQVRNAHVQPKRQMYGNGYQGYAVDLKWTTDRRNLEARTYEALAPDLIQLTLVLFRWLIQKSELGDLIQEFSWLENGRYRDH